MARYFFYLLFLTMVISCKKKEENNDTIPVTSTPQEATYQSNLQTRLCLTSNGGNFDTSFTFTGKYVKIIGSSQTWSSFSSTNYNGYIANTGNNFNGDILSSPNFMALANNSIWNINSSEFGNFQYTDSLQTASISASLTVIPTTYDASQGIPIKIEGLQGASSVTLGEKSQLYFNNGYIKMYTPTSSPSSLGTIKDTIQDPELFSFPINTTFTLSINCGVSFSQYINGHQSFIFKTTTYYFPIKRIN